MSRDLIARVRKLEERQQIRRSIQSFKNPPIEYPKSDTCLVDAVSSVTNWRTAARKPEGWRELQKATSFEAMIDRVEQFANRFDPEEYAQGQWCVSATVRMFEWLVVTILELNGHWSEKRFSVRHSDWQSWSEEFVSAHQRLGRTTAKLWVEAGEPDLKAGADDPYLPQLAERWLAGVELNRHANDFLQKSLNSQKKFDSIDAEDVKQFLRSQAKRCTL